MKKLITIINTLVTDLINMLYTLDIESKNLIYLLKTPEKAVHYYILKGILAYCYLLIILRSI